MRFLQLAIIFLLCLRVFTFFYTKPIIKSGTYVKVSAILTARPKIAFKKLQFKLDDQLVEIDVSQCTRLKYKTREIRFKIVAVYGPVIKRDQNLVLIGKRILIVDAGIFGAALKFFNSISEFVVATCFEIFPHDEAGIMIGILLGESGFVSHNMYEAFKTAGVLHLFAASGMNLVIFGGFVRQSLILFVKRKKAECLAAASVIFYVFLSGFSPSILRAGVMYFSIFGGHVFGRPVKAQWNLFFAVTTLIFVNPELIFNLGFQLSVLSTWGLIVKPIGDGSSVNGNDARYGETRQTATKPVSSCGYGNGSKPKDVTDVSETGILTERRVTTFSERASLPVTDVYDSQIKYFVYNLWKMFSSDFQTSLSCFLFTAPLIIFSFGQINLLAVAVNVLVLWTIDLLMIGGGILIVLRAIGFVFIKSCALLVMPLLMFFKQVVLIFSSYNFGVINFDWHGNTVLFLIFCLICWISFLIKTEKRANREPNQ